MRVKIKELVIEGGRPRWRPLLADGLIGQSVADYMLATDKQVIVALYEGPPPENEDEDSEPIAFVSNHITLVDMYKERGVSLHVREIKDLLGTTIVPPMVAYSLGGEIVSINALSEGESK